MAAFSSDMKASAELYSLFFDPTCQKFPLKLFEIVAERYSGSLVNMFRNASGKLPRFSEAKAFR